MIVESFQKPFNMSLQTAHQFTAITYRTF